MMLLALALMGVAVAPDAWAQEGESQIADSSAQAADASGLQGDDLATYEAIRRSVWDNQVRVLFCGIAAVVLLAGIVIAAMHRQTEAFRKPLYRTSVTLAVIAVAEQMFFKEPWTTAILMALAFCVGAVVLAMPQGAAEASDGEGDSLQMQEGEHD